MTIDKDRHYIMVEPRNSYGYGRLHFSIEATDDKPPKIMHFPLGKGLVLVRNAVYANGLKEWSYSVEQVETNYGTLHSRDPFDRNFVINN